MSSQRFETLDAMRGVAAVAVVCLHIQSELKLLGPITLPHAYLAVDFFFALSGLVMVRAYGKRFDAGLGVWQFFKMRAVRLYPLYILGTLMGVAVTLWPMFRGDTAWPGGLVFVSTLVTSLLMLPSSSLGLSPAYILPFNPAGWSLFFELVVNVLLVVFWRYLSPRVLASCLMASGAILVAQTVSFGDISYGALWSTVALGIDRAVFSFLLGVWLARVTMQPNATKPGYKAWLPLSVLTLAFLPAQDIGPWYDLACVMILFPLLLVWGTAVQPIGARAFHFLGAISFAVYVIHGPLLLATNIALYHLPEGLRSSAPWGGIILVVGFVLAAAVADKADRLVRERLRWAVGSPRSGAL